LTGVNRDEYLTEVINWLIDLPEPIRKQEDSIIKGLVNVITSTNSLWVYKIYFQLLNHSETLFEKISRITIQHFMGASKEYSPLLDVLEAPCYLYLLKSERRTERLQCLNNYQVLSTDQDSTFCTCLTVLTGEKKQVMEGWLSEKLNKNYRMKALEYLNHRKFFASRKAFQNVGPYGNNS
jgi:hypothetical protein